MSDRAPVARPRYSTTPLPPYSYVPRHTPHPVSDPRGHMHGHSAETPPPLNPGRWQDAAAYRYGIDLFNHGFYWEAHEAWESLWHAAGRSGPVAIWLKALIKLAAAAVKVREGNGLGATRHAQRCRQLLQELRQANSPHQAWSGLEAIEGDHYCGVEMREVDEIAAAIALEAERGLSDPAPRRVLDHWIRLLI